jgi:hypothetical protein
VTNLRAVAISRVPIARSRITTCYARLCAEREYVWSDDGVRSAGRNEVELAEAVDALYAPPGLRFERRVGDSLLIVMGMAGTGRVIAVLCDSIEHTTRYRIIGCRPLAGADLDEWRRNLG